MERFVGSETGPPFVLCGGGSVALSGRVSATPVTEREGKTVGERSGAVPRSEGPG